MNSEANQDEQAFEEFFWSWLQPSKLLATSAIAGDGMTPASESELSLGGQSGEWEEFDPLDAEEIDFLDPDSPSFSLGEKPTVQDRFQTLLKERLKAEIQRNPPLFPWETELIDYNPDYSDSFVHEWVPPLHLWAAQRQNLKWGQMPIPITETVFAQLLGSCEQVAQSELRAGAKLVQAVNHLFPGQSQVLNDLAGKVLMGASRERLNPDQFPSDYDQATPDQQMVLSLLAAREMIEALTLTCGCNRGAVKRQWLTAVGLLSLEVSYQGTENQEEILQILGNLPAAGGLELKGLNTEEAVERSEPGTLELQVRKPHPEQTYTLKVWFESQKQKTLTFAVCPSSMLPRP